MEIFPEKNVIQNSWSAKTNFSVPPKLGARSPPLVLENLPVPNKKLTGFVLVCRFEVWSP